MGAAVAALGWRPQEFWRATPVEFWDAFKAYEQMNCTPREP